MFSIINRMNNSLKVTYIYLALGVMLIVAGIFVAKSSISFVERAVKANGMVIELVKRDKHFYPKVKFQDRNGVFYEFLSNAGCKPACYKDKDTVDVLYIDSEPFEAKIDSFSSLWMPVVGMILVGLIFIGVSMVQRRKLKLKVS